MVRCADNTLYAGVTTDITRRVAEHNGSPKGAKYTATRRPVTLVYRAEYPDRSTAQKAEAVLKKLPREAKLQLIQVSPITE